MKKMLAGDNLPQQARYAVHVRITGQMHWYPAKVVFADSKFRTVILVAPEGMPVMGGPLTVHPELGPVMVLRPTKIGGCFAELFNRMTYEVKRVKRST